MSDSGKVAWGYPDPNPWSGISPTDPPGATPTPPVVEPPKPSEREPVERRQVADDLLWLFGRLAGLILVVMVMMTAALAVFRPEADLSSLATLLNTQLSLLIGAVLGYAAYPARRSDR